MSWYLILLILKLLSVFHVNTSIANVPVCYFIFASDLHKLWSFIREKLVLSPILFLLSHEMAFIFLSIHTKFFEEECFQIILPELYFSTPSLNLSAMGKEEDMCPRLSALIGASSIWSVANDWYKINTNWGKQKGTQLLLIIWVWENIYLILPVCERKGFHHIMSTVAKIGVDLVCFVVTAV